MPTLSNRYVVLAAIFTVRDNSNASIEICVISLSLVEEDISQNIFQLDGVMEQLRTHRKSDVAAEIIKIAARFQETASDNCLGRPRTQNASL
jgi:hypothetical protein